MEEASYSQETNASSTKMVDEIDRLTPALDRIYEQIEKVQIELPKTEEVLHKVVEAAEHNQAIEKIFELRHEVKDEAVLHQGSSTTSMAGLIQQKAQQMNAVINPAPSSVVKKGMQIRLFSGNSLYAQAVTYGFITAILSLFIAIIAVALFT